MSARLPALLAIALVCGCPAQEQRPGAPEPATPAPALESPVTELAFGAVDFPSVGVRTVQIHNPSLAQIVFSVGLEVDSPDVRLLDPPSAAMTLAPDQSQAFTIEFAPLRGAPVAGTLTLLQDGDQGRLDLPISGVGRAPALAIEPSDEVTLDGADWRCPRSSTLRLRSVGALPVRVDSVSLDTGAGWTLDAGLLPVVLQPGDEREVTLGWVPESPGDGAATVLVQSSDALEGTRAVDVVATAQAAPTAIRSQLIEPRTDVLIVTSDCGGYYYCDIGGVGGQGPDEPVVALAGALAAREIDFRMAGLPSDGDGLVQQYNTDPEAPQIQIVTATSTLSEIWEIVLSGSEQGCPSLPLESLSAAAQSPPFGAQFHRPGARMLIVVLRETLGFDEGAAAVVDAETAIDAAVLAPDLWSAHMSGGYGFSMAGMQSLFDFVALRAGLLDDICDSDFAPFIDGLVDLAELPTRFVAVEALDGTPISVDLNGSPAAGWTWWPAPSLLELTAAPDRGDSLLVTYEPPAQCQ